MALAAASWAQATPNTHSLRLQAGTAFEMAVPSGLCVPDERAAAANRYLGLMESALNQVAPPAHGRVAGTFVECPALDETNERFGAMPQRWALATFVFLTPDEGPLAGYDRQAMIQGMAKYIPAVSDLLDEPGMRQRVDRLAREACKPAAVECRFDLKEVVGTSSDDEGLFLTVLGNLAVDDNVVHVIGTSGMTLIKGYPVSIASYRVLQSAADYDAVLAETRAVISDLIARNDPEGAAVEK